MITRSEALLGWPLPEDVRQFYAEVTNGGGPFYVLGLVGGGTDDLGNTAIDLALAAREPDPDEDESGSGYVLRDDVLPILYWGCSVYSWVCTDGTMVGQDGWDWIATAARSGSGSPIG